MCVASHENIGTQKNRPRLRVGERMSLRCCSLSNATTARLHNNAPMLYLRCPFREAVKIWGGRRPGSAHRALQLRDSAGLAPASHFSPAIRGTGTSPRRVFTCSYRGTIIAQRRPPVESWEGSNCSQLGGKNFKQEQRQNQRAGAGIPEKRSVPAPATSQRGSLTPYGSLCRRHCDCRH